MLLLLTLAFAEEQRYALVIGADQGSGEDHPLRFAEHDARRVGETLLDVGGVEAEDLVVLEGAQASDVRRSLAQLQKRLDSEVGPDDTALVFVYYSGHADSTALHLYGTELPLVELRTTVETLNAGVKLLVVDACQAGELLRRRGGAQVDPFEIEVAEALASEGMVVITSAAAGEDAMESDRLQGGVFTHHLVAGLSGGADRDADRRVTLEELYRYTYDRTLAYTTTAPVMQHPGFDVDLTGSAELVLSELGGRRTGRLELKEAGLYVVFEEDGGRLVTEVDVPAGGTLALADGAYRVLRREEDRVYGAKVRVVAGETRSLGEMELLPMGQGARRGETTEPHTPLALMVGGGPALSPNDIGWGPSGQAALRLELRPVSLALGVRGWRGSSLNQELSLTQTTGGVWVSALRYTDLGRWSPGLGLSGGADLTWQTFDTEGIAPDRQAFSGRIGPTARLDLAVGPRVTIGLELALDIQLVPITDVGDERTSVDATVTPRGGLDVSFWFR